MANHGTLFLDEVGDIPLDLQPKLLRALREKSFERLGGTRTIPIDVRLVAATNRNLLQMMGDKLFRSDLTITQHESLWRARVEENDDPTSALSDGTDYVSPERAKRGAVTIAQELFGS
jgi:sigma54-dependent transcription regulator